VTQEQFFKIFLEEQQLPTSYERIARAYFIPLVNKLHAHSNKMNRPIIIGVNGSQGSGKSTLTSFLVAYLNQIKNCPAIGLSIDDFYLKKSERQKLAQTEHPLLVTRGVPGTHDLDLLIQTIDSLLNQNPPYSIPVFLKSKDDRAPKHLWQNVNFNVNIIILEGWCIGCPSQKSEDLVSPVNSLEATEDEDSHWRSYSNRALKSYEQSLFSKLDRLVMLKAPGFHVVKKWRLEQEDKLRLSSKGEAIKSGIMSEDQIERFIAHYQRITDHGLLKIPDIADDIFYLDDQRAIVSVHTKSTL
jgi:D-glycerate 3-kinase